jgi:hypothetical protein|tara:strand:- start:244 stop:687 length:444 start_codon:yes stop_codon:yes gene_type:complete
MANNYSRVYNRSVRENVYWVERDSIGLAVYDPLESEKNRFKSLSSALTVTLFYHKKADHFGRQIALDGTVTDTTNSTTLMDEQSELPEQFHQFLVDKAIQLGYEQKPEMIQMAGYFNQKFEKGIKEGKTYKNRNRISGVRHVRQSSY